MEISKLKKCSRRLLVAAGKLFCLMHFEEIGTQNFEQVLDLFSVVPIVRMEMREMMLEKKIVIDEQISQESFRELLCVLKKELLEVEAEAVYEIHANESERSYSTHQGGQSLRALEALLSSYVKKLPGE